MEFVQKGLVIVFSLIILTILVYHGFSEKKKAEAVRTAETTPPPPPKTKMDYIPVQENFAMFRGPSEEDKCHFVPDAPYCASARYSDAYPTKATEGFVEGMASLDDFSSFFSILLEMLWLIVYVLITLPEHIFFFFEGLIWLFLAGLDIFIEFLFEFALGWYDLGVIFVDITRCGLTWSKNLPKCLLWYLIDVFIYFMVMIFIWVPILIIRICTFGMVDVNPLYVSILGVKGYPDVDQGYIEQDGIIANISHMCYRYTGYEFMHFPDVILNQCYSCDLIGDTLNFISDMAMGILRMMEYAFRDIGYSIPLFWHASYLDMLFNPPGLGKFPPGPPASGNLEKYKPPPVPPRLAGSDRAPKMSSQDLHGGGG